MVAVERQRMPRQKSLRRRRGGRTAFLAAFVVLLGLIWSGYWYAAYRMADYAVADNSAHAAFGITCDNRGIGGYPLQIDLSCGRITAEAGAMTLTGGRLAATAPLYRPGYVTADLTAPVRWEAPELGLSAEATWSAAKGFAEAGLSGLSSVAADINGFNLTFADAGYALLDVSASRLSAALAPDDAAADALRLDVATDQFAIGDADNAFPRLSGEGSLTLVGAGGSIGTDPRDTLARWLAAGGRFTVDRARLTSGDVTAWAEGPMAMEPDGALTGELTVRFRGRDSLEPIAAAIFPHHRSLAKQLVQAVIALSKPLQTADGEVNEVRLTFDQGKVSVGFIPILTIPPLASLVAQR